MICPCSNILPRRWRWLAPRYVAIKVNANNYASKEGAEHELEITQRITQVNSAHEGRYFVLTLLDSFEMLGPHGNHICMVFEPLGEPLWMLKHRFRGATLPPDVLRKVMLQLRSIRHIGDSDGRSQSSHGPIACPHDHVSVGGFALQFGVYLSRHCNQGRGALGLSDQL